MRSIHKHCLCVLLALSTMPAFCAEFAPSEARSLDASAPEVNRTVVRDSMIGPRDTLVFYHFNEQHAVLMLQIDNHSPQFPIKATLHLFGQDVSAPKLVEWINNQHSDAIHPDVPSPTASIPLAADTCKTVSSKSIGHREHGGVSYDDITVSYQVAAVRKDGQFILKPFTGEAGVYVPKPAAP